RGIGAASVQALAEDGFDVAWTWVSRPPDAAQQIAGARTEAYRADVREPAQVAEVFERAQADFGRAPHCVLANAGINVPPGPMAQFDPANMRALVETNIVGAFNILQMAARNVADNGVILALTSSMVRHAVPGGGPY